MSVPQPRLKSKLQNACFTFAFGELASQVLVFQSGWGPTNAKKFEALGVTAIVLKKKYVLDHGSFRFAFGPGRHADLDAACRFKITQKRRSIAIAILRSRSCLQ
jgi:hypothetical protein